MRTIYSHLLALDIDGTLFTSDKELTGRTVCALNNVIAAGCAVVLATGRPFSGIPDELMEFPGIRYAITSNGAITIDITTGATTARRLSAKQISVTAPS